VPGCRKRRGSFAASGDRVHRLGMFVRQCLNCGVIDARDVWEDEDEAARTNDWECVECRSTEFEVVVMPDPEPATEADVEE
jgi:hypothetical protein